MASTRFSAMRHQRVANAAGQDVGYGCLVLLLGASLVAAVVGAYLLFWQQDDAALPLDGKTSGTNEEQSLEDVWPKDVSGAEVTSYETQEDLTHTATDVVCRYRDEETCVVRSAGYLGLLGNTWSCVMEGPGWVDLCVVLQGEHGCVVKTARLEASAWKEMYGT